MRDPNLLSELDLDQAIWNFKRGRPRPVEQYEGRSNSQLREDVTRVTDLSLKLIGERDRLIARAEDEKLWTRILLYSLGACGSIIAFLALELFARLK